MFVFSVRGEKIIFDFHLASLYNVENRVLRQSIKRNKERFPEDFMFELTKSEWQEVITNCDNLPDSLKYSPTRPYAFTEQGVAMLSSILKSKQAILVNIHIIRTFVELRRLVNQYSDLQQKIEKIEKKYDDQFRVVFDVIQQVIREEMKPKKSIGFGKVT